MPRYGANISPERDNMGTDFYAGGMVALA